METQLYRITINQQICGGKPTIRGKRISVETILEFLTAGDSYSEILEQYPTLEHEDITACLQFALELMKHNYSVKELTRA